MLAEIGRDRELAAVQRRVAEAVDAVLGRDLQGDEVPAGAADDDLGVDDFHQWGSAIGRAAGVRGSSATAAAPASAIENQHENPVR